MFFLKDDEKQSVEVKEVEEIDFIEVKKHIEQGESVFITRKRKQELDASLIAGENAAELWYFSHIQGSDRSAEEERNETNTQDKRR